MLQLDITPECQATLTVHETFFANAICTIIIGVFLQFSVQKTEIFVKFDFSGLRVKTKKKALILNDVENDFCLKMCFWDPKGPFSVIYIHISPYLSFVGKVIF